ncbi:hypothetical protein LVD17_05295 [Fulvivirga ulvae]|nr:hypothetical protein [Fulvivirga ulvae]UII33238.1 hypothetical protein LVD17_05295 [Fulvivirga ulvae]
MTVLSPTHFFKPILSTSQRMSLEEDSTAFSVQASDIEQVRFYWCS